MFIKLFHYTISYHQNLFTQKLESTRIYSFISLYSLLSLLLSLLYTVAMHICVHFAYDSNNNSSWIGNFVYSHMKILQIYRVIWFDPSHFWLPMTITAPVHSQIIRWYLLPVYLHHLHHHLYTIWNQHINMICNRKFRFFFSKEDEKIKKI